MSKMDRIDLISVIHSCAALIFVDDNAREVNGIRQEQVCCCVGLLCVCQQLMKTPLILLVLMVLITSSIQVYLYLFVARIASKRLVIVVRY